MKFLIVNRRSDHLLEEDLLVKQQVADTTVIYLPVGREGEGVKLLVITGVLPHRCPERGPPYEMSVLIAHPQPSPAGLCPLAAPCPCACLCLGSRRRCWRGCHPPRRYAHLPAPLRLPLHLPRLPRSPPLPCCALRPRPLPLPAPRLPRPSLRWMSGSAAWTSATRSGLDLGCLLPPNARSDRGFGLDCWIWTSMKCNLLKSCDRFWLNDRSSMRIPRDLRTSVTSTMPHHGKPAPSPAHRAPV